MRVTTALVSPVTVEYLEMLDPVLVKKFLQETIVNCLQHFQDFKQL